MTTRFPAGSPDERINVVSKKVVIGATGAVSSQTGRGGIVTRTAVGTYRLTLTTAQAALLYADVSKLDSGARSGGQFYAESWTNPATADVDAIAVTVGSTAGIQTLTGVALDGVVGDDTMTPPRNLTITFSNHADWDATTIVIAGTDVNGDVISEDFAVPNGGNQTVTGAKAFATVTSVTIPAQTGAGGTATIGFGAKIGLARKLYTRSGLTMQVSENEAGSKVHTGTFVAPATGAPNGTYAPSNAPNATRDYAVVYEVDPADGALGDWQVTAEDVASAKTIDFKHRVGGDATDPLSGVVLHFLVMCRGV
jgi:hypothetical protein